MGIVSTRGGSISSSVVLIDTFDVGFKKPTGLILVGFFVGASTSNEEPTVTPSLKPRNGSWTDVSVRFAREGS
jgi:hypothetical protein